MGWPTGLEPATARTTIWSSTIELWPPFEVPEDSEGSGVAKRILGEGVISDFRFQISDLKARGVRESAQSKTRNCLAAKERKERKERKLRVQASFTQQVNTGRFSKMSPPLLFAFSAPFPGYSNC